MSEKMSFSEMKELLKSHEKARGKTAPLRIILPMERPPANTFRGTVEENIP